MITLYETDKNRIYSGSREISEYDRIPPGSSITEPPPLAESQFAQLQGSTWAILDEYPAEQEKSPEQIQQEIISEVQKRLDDFAKTNNYDGILSATTYATDPNPKFSLEGQRAVELRSATWDKLYQILAEVQSGMRPMPNSYADIESELPSLTWE